MALPFVRPRCSCSSKEMKKESVACGLLRMLLACLLRMLLASSFSCLFFFVIFLWAPRTRMTRCTGIFGAWPQATKFMALPFVHPSCSCSSKEMKKQSCLLPFLHGFLRHFLRVPQPPPGIRTTSPSSSLSIQVVLTWLQRKVEMKQPPDMHTLASFSVCLASLVRFWHPELPSCLLGCTTCCSPAHLPPGVFCHVTKPLIFVLLMSAHRKWVEGCHDSPGKRRQHVTIVTQRTWHRRLSAVMQRNWSV